MVRAEPPTPSFAVAVDDIASRRSVFPSVGPEGTHQGTVRHDQFDYCLAESTFRFKPPDFEKPWQARLMPAPASRGGRAGTVQTQLPGRPRLVRLATTERRGTGVTRISR